VSALSLAAFPLRIAVARPLAALCRAWRLTSLGASEGVVLTMYEVVHIGPAPVAPRAPGGAANHIWAAPKDQLIHRPWTRRRVKSFRLPSLIRTLTVYPVRRLTSERLSTHSSEPA
jgi:hypothetical protein